MTMRFCASIPKMMKSPLKVWTLKMRQRLFLWIFGSILVFSTAKTAMAHADIVGRHPSRKRYRAARIYRHYAPHSEHISYLWCVPYARKLSHIALRGDAFLWWAEAEGRYPRGPRPQVGSILAFRSIPRMPLGHLAVVVKIISSREILVNEANWVPDAVTRNVPVIDVSPDNTWTDVRQSTGNGNFGMSYAAYGFIYNDGPRTLIAGRTAENEVAQAPATPRLRSSGPNRNLR